jgi:hypothetical protein
MLAVLSMFVLSGCAMTIPMSANDDAVCTVWRDVSWSKKDTDQTIAEVKQNNARRDGWCHGAK